ncbi:MAG: hypothetical protein A2287_07545 [Candidatus Melainabacteria bacterium RIFOXYA12_FULL_32_12]|nr:MAG: hypothetical protein A2104_06255 [Candidatus Melainabacteria bacterium GWF2_32_7]OGI17482.1 MAG: hypothetical protein A2255_08445 [Candidatus Melainabacteria bacterium RIFOXYA2_FULL_32_9]OGI29105.1 MAG: hypothetical protein A2287_07545 [Candidatus Melainabacteria bacterium RIFOXYA12_FULL_32_12]
MDGATLFMNVNEECLLQFLENPGRLELTTKELKRTIFIQNDNIILSNKSLRERLKLINA